MHCYGRAAKRRRDRKYKRKLKRLHSFGTITPAIWYVLCDKDSIDAPSDVCLDTDYGKIWFTSREEAERKLEEMGE